MFPIRLKVFACPSSSVAFFIKVTLAVETDPLNGLTRFKFISSFHYIQSGH